MTRLDLSDVPLSLVQATVDEWTAAADARITELEAVRDTLQAELDRLTEKTLLDPAWFATQFRTLTPLKRFATVVEDASGVTIRITLGQNTDGIKWTFPLPEPMRGGRFEYDLRLTGSPGKGAKVGPGLGGVVPGSGLSSPPSGGKATPYGWSTRLMANNRAVGGLFVDAANLSAYCYTEDLPKDSYGKGVQIAERVGTLTRFDEKWRPVRVGTAPDALSVVAGTSSLDRPMVRTADATHGVWSTFYGGDLSWAGPGCVVEIRNPRVVKTA